MHMWLLAPDGIAHHTSCPQMCQHLAMHVAWRRCDMSADPIVRMGLGRGGDCGVGGPQLTRTQ
eukprot:9441098-Pyramimonas_sp.AAC.1